MRKRVTASLLRQSAPDEEVEPAVKIIKEEKETPKVQAFPVLTV